MSDLIETAKQLMALGDFRWWDAMADTDGDRVVSGPDDIQGDCIRIYRERRGHLHGAYPSDMAPPDLTDPGTQGCVMAWAEEVFGDRFCVVGYKDGFSARWCTGLIDAWGDTCPTKIEAACAALLGAR